MKVNIDFTQQENGQISGTCSACGELFEGELRGTIKLFIEHTDDHNSQGGVVSVTPWWKRRAVA